MIFRTRDLLVRQRTQLINALRGHLAEHGVVAPQGTAHVKRLADVIGDETAALPATVREIGRLYLEQIDTLNGRIDTLGKKLRAEAGQAEPTRRLQTMPGVGPITAVAIESFAPPMETFRRGRDFAAWVGLVPRQNSTGGKQRLGRTAKMGQRDIRRLLIIGAMAVVNSATRHGAPEGSWLERMLAKKPKMLVAIALANKMARGHLGDDDETGGLSVSGGGCSLSKSIRKQSPGASGGVRRSTRSKGTRSARSGSDEAVWVREPRSSYS